MQRGLRRCLGDPDSTPASRAKNPFTWKGVGLGRKTMAALFVLFAIVMGLALWGLETHYQTVNKNELNRTTNQVTIEPISETSPKPTMTPKSRKRRSSDDNKFTTACGAILVLEYTKGTTTSYTFDLCDVISCGGSNWSFRGYDVYLCYPYGQMDMCERTGHGTKDAPPHTVNKQFMGRER